MTTLWCYREMEVNESGNAGLWHIKIRSRYRHTALLSQLTGLEVIENLDV